MNKSITNYSKLAAFLLIGSALLSACKKDRVSVVDRVPTSTLGIYVLCEGAYGVANNSSITYYDVATSTSTTDFFKKQNGVALGSNANDLKQYGSKMYCVITGTTQEAKDSYVEVINTATGKSIKRIPFSDGIKGFMPRYVGFYQGKAYVSGYDGYISKIDTASLAIEARTAVGGALEGLTIVNGKLYVANSSHPFYVSSNNSSVSVVDLTTFTKLKEISVSFNPTKLAATAAGNVFAITSGSYTPFISPAFEQLNSVTDTKTKTYDYSLSAITVSASKGYVITGDYPAELKTFDIAAATIGDSFIKDNTEVSALYAVSCNAFNNDVVVSDALNYGPEGKVIVFSAAGAKKFDFATGSVPQTAVFNYSYK